MKNYLKKSSYFVPINLKIAIGCEDILLKNIDAPKGLVNGRIGTILDIFKWKNDVKTILVAIFNKLLDDKLKVETIKQKIWKTELLNCSKMLLYQFPLKVRYGVTAHIIQSQILKK